MIRVVYERYINDNCWSDIDRYFFDLQEIRDWLFENVTGLYAEKMYFINPDENHIRNGVLKLSDTDMSILSKDGSTYFIKLISYEPGNKIIYSSGSLTNGMCHWNEEIKQWIRDCRSRRDNPKFNFID